MVLPAEGRKGRTPKWPLPANPRLTARINLLQDAIDELEERETRRRQSSTGPREPR
ncbi:hypothetical protein G5V59_26890 [Nocardioides sp. W3-2-3]|uniref:hypothetical protein n=1 Tax=Nocardioides convexus TaxID=2712224 RepID=UPI002418A7ED|nr:hypothetical protein [Nocardioides convexus]NHA02020.1 hypothetical protein [Nocardioides convexus]